MSTEADIAGFELLLGFEEPSVFQEYIDLVANRELLRYKGIPQYGGKAGQSLYVHILNGICILEQVRAIAGLDELEIRILFTAYTLHDLNKLESSRKSYGNLVTPERVHQEIIRHGLDQFFPEYEAYVQDIISLMRAHSGHYHHGLERLDLSRASVYGLDVERVNQLVHLMRAVDNLDLAHSLDAQAHLDKFLSELNVVTDEQFTFVYHRIDEHRGLLTNMLHNAVVAELQEHGLRPLLFFPDGVAYLAERDAVFVPDTSLVEQIAERVGSAFNTLTTRKFEQFIDVRPLGIRIAPKCLELGLSFRNLLDVIDVIIQRRTFKPDVLAENAWRRGQERLATVTLEDEQRATVLNWLSGNLVATEQARLRTAELIRTYYIFLNEHFKTVVKDAWARVYDLLDVPVEHRSMYDIFDARQDRAYVLINHLAFSGMEVQQRIEQDGAELLGERKQHNLRVPLFAEYLRLSLRFSTSSTPTSNFSRYLARYVAGQHRQCVTCSSPFTTLDWMKPDVRSEISVNTFSNRLRGGPGEPKKRVCAICQLQFLLEKLVFEEVRGENVRYFHLFPYSFLTAPFIEGLRRTATRIVVEDDQARALFLRVDDWMLRDDWQPPQFVTRTNKGDPHPYGVYVPRYAESIGNLIILPLNAPGGNETERFLFALQQGMLLQRHLGMKVLISESPVPPLYDESVSDLYVDGPPLSSRGLISHNTFTTFRGPRDNAPGELPELWDRIRRLHQIKRALFVAGSERDPFVELVRALGGHPMAVFTVAGRLLEERIRRDRRLTQPGPLRSQLAQTVLPHLQTLAISKGGAAVALLSDHLQHLASIAAEYWLRNKSDTRNSLMTPVDAIFKTVNHRSPAFDEAALRAVISEDIFAYLLRIATEKYKPGARKREGVRQFVDVFFDDIYGGVYKHNLARLLGDERMLRSAFYFYVQDAYTKRRAARKAAGKPEEDLDQESEAI